MSQLLPNFINPARLKTATDLTTKQYYIVKLSAQDTVAINDAAANAFGVLQNDPYTNEEAEVAVVGECKVYSYDTIAAGGYFKSDTSGRAVAAGTTPTKTDVILGVALEDMVAGYVYRAFLFPVQVHNHS